MSVEEHDKIEEVIDETVETQEPEYTEIELEAMQHGWRPKEEYEGDPSQWRSAETFMALKPFFEKIERQSKEIKNFKKAQQEVIKEVANMRKTEYDRALRTLKQERKAAFEEGDLDRYHQLDDEIDEIQDQRRNIPTDVNIVDEDDTNEAAAQFIEWKGRNTWYERDEDLRAWADGRGVSLAKRGVDPVEVLTILQKEVREKFPEKFENPNREKPAAVSTGRGGTRSKSTEAGMSPEEKRIMETIVRSGAMTKEEYLKEYQKVRGN